MRKILIVLLVFLTPASAIAGKRVGLVIGNDRYSEVPQLQKAGADAQSVSETLRAQGFEIVTVLDAPRREMNRKISTFTSMLEPGDTAFIFFAGHGVEIDGENYLLPTDIIAPATGEREFVKSESIALSRLLDLVRATGARATIAVIDACRNNPFEQTAGRSIGTTRGLGRITAPEGTFVIFSAGAGQLALDELNREDPARNSVFTRTLLPRLADPDLELRAMMADLRVEVRQLARTVNHEQFPAYYDELLGEFYFARTAAAAQAKPADTLTTTPPEAPSRMAAQPPADLMRQDFELARSIGSKGALQAFLDRYSDRSSEFTYRMAVQILEKMQPTLPQTPSEPEQPSVAAILVPAPTPSDPQPTNRRDIIRQTQTALNEAGCSAGGADGVIGNRTRRAFARYISDTGVSLSTSDLGTEKAVQILQSSNKKCTAQVAVAPAPAAKQTGSGYNLSGKWKFRSSCPLFIKTTGSVSYVRTGPNTFKGTLNDSLGQTATERVTLSGRKMKSVQYFPNITVHSTGTIAQDGTSYTGTTSVGCVSTVWRD